MTNRRLSRVLIGIIGIITLGSAAYYATHAREGVYSYNVSTDRQFILDTIKNNWYWLVTDPTSNFDPSYMENRFLLHNPEGGNIFVKVYRIQGKPIGFITYYKRNFYKGVINLLAIDENYRGKGYSDKLLNAAINDLQHQGSTSVQLITRVTNEPAKKLYIRSGFKESGLNNGIVHYEKSLS